VRCIVGRSDRGELSESFGTLRYGNLVEVLMYDVRRTLQVGEMNAAFLDPVVENWLAARTASHDTRHLVHAPSNPPGWSAGAGIELVGLPAFLSPYR